MIFFNKKEKGIAGEQMAERFLKKKGYKIIRKNFYSKFGEIDIIAKDKEYLTFIEVKLRNSDKFGNIEYSIDSKKKKHILKTAYYFLINNKEYENYDLRFDALFIYKIRDKNKYKISLMKNIFSFDNNINGFY